MFFVNGVSSPPQVLPKHHPSQSPRQPKSTQAKYQRQAQELIGCFLGFLVTDTPTLSSEGNTGQRESIRSRGRHIDGGITQRIYHIGGHKDL